MERVFELLIPAALSENTIKQILYHHYRMSSRLIAKIKRNGGILLNERAQSVRAVVKMGDRLKIIIPSEKSLNIVPNAMPLDIVYEDQDVMVVNKPPGLLVHPSQGHYSRTLANGVVHHWQTKGCSYVFRPVHRLDKDTSGLMVIAKNQYAHQQLSDQVAANCLERKYIAVVLGRIRCREGTIDEPIARKPGSIIERWISGDGQRAVTHYRVIKRLQRLTVVELALQTGRTHQIRVHMRHMGHPLAGDWLYGKEDDSLISRQALHAKYLAFTHPVNGQAMCFERGMPEDMEALILPFYSTKSAQKDKV